MSATSAGALALSMIAEGEARDAKKITCKKFIDGYTNTKATVESKQQYAECIDFLYPKELNGSEIVLAKIVIALALIGAVIGFMWGAADDGLAAGAAFLVIGALALPFSGFCIILVYQGIKFLFS